jgi:hypothetical protein
MRSLGAIAPPRPSAEAGMIVGIKQAAPAAVAVLRHCRRLSFFGIGPVRGIALSPSKSVFASSPGYNEL